MVIRNVNCVRDKDTAAENHVRTIDSVEIAEDCEGQWGNYKGLKVRKNGIDSKVRK